MDRRELLAKASVCTSTVAFAGCSLNPFGCGKGHQIIISATKVELTEAQRDNLSIIVTSNLPDGEKKIIQKAIRNEEYAECYPGSEELQSFVNRVERRKAEQFENYDGTPPEYLNSVYVNKDGAYYKLYVTVEDEVISDP
jgi:hypothetical protein